MGGSGRLGFAPLPAPAVLELSVCCHFDDLSQRLSVAAGGHDETFELAHGWNTLSVELPAGADEARLSVDRLLPLERHPGDGRDLGVQLEAPVLHRDAGRHASSRERQAAGVAAARDLLASPLAAFLATARDLRYERGFHHPERGDGLAFRWMATRARLAFDPRPEPRYLELGVHSHFHDLSQRLRLAPELGEAEDSELVHGWNSLSVVVP